MRAISAATLFTYLLLICAVWAPGQATGPETASLAGEKEWIKRSNEYAQILLKLDAKYDPEGAGREGMEGLDEQVIRIPADRREREKADTQSAIVELQSALAAEKDPQVKQDLEIMIRSAQLRVGGIDIDEKYEMPYFNVAGMIFSGVHALLDDQIPEERRRAAVVRLRKYTGMEPGFESVVDQAKARTLEWARPGQLGPRRGEVENDLARNESVIQGIGDLFEKYKIEGYQEPFAKLKQQLNDYNDWLKREVLPKTRTDFRLPPEEYAFKLEQEGVDIPPQELAAKAHLAFTETQREMQEIAAKIAMQRGWKSSGYRDAIRELKKDQLVGEAIVPQYEKTLKQIEEIIRRRKLVTLPIRPASIRLATAAETVQTPAPHMEAPPLLHNTGQHGTFVLPLNLPAAPGSAETKKTDDFTYTAATWTMTAHEARPGHELQFDAMVERGVSAPRALFAMSGANIEGWGLYAEYIAKPYIPLDGQLISLQLLLLRAARAFIDPELQSGKLKPEDAMRILTQEVVLSEGFANSEVERYTYWAPGQATSYFYGFTRLRELRKEVEAKMGKKFDQRKFHDFILSQGLLPPALLRNVVMENFVERRY